MDTIRTRLQGRIQGGFGGQTPPFWKSFFNLLGFFEKKISTPPLNFPVDTKKIKTPPRKTSGYAPARLV